MSGLLAHPLNAREHQSFDKDWLFVLADSAGMQKSEYADGHWRRLNLPHDWAIEGDFAPSNPSGASGGALPGGIGWYRKHFSVNPKEKYDRFTITFDGVYMNSTVYINGHKLGTRPYGYSTFEYDLTPYINRKGDNVIAVKVDNSDQPNSRWYSGCGIYRHVWLTKTMKKAYIPQWGQYVSTGSTAGSRRIGWGEVALYRPIVRQIEMAPVDIHIIHLLHACTVGKRKKPALVEELAFTGAQRQSARDKHDYS